jgi:hypothetical protein
MAKEKRSKLGLTLEASMREAVAHKRDEIALPTCVIEAMPAARVKEIRKKVAKNGRSMKDHVN